jgi:enterochelin esterase family protein
MHPRLRQLETELRAGQPGAEQRFWRAVEAGGAPLVRRTDADTCQVTFVWRHDGAARSVAVIQDWGADGLREHFMDRLPGTEVWHLERPYPSDAITSYQFSPSADPDPRAPGPYQRDPLNPQHAIAFLSETGNDFVFSALRLPDAPEPVAPVEETLRGRIEVHHPTPGRRAWSYTPALPSPEPHPLLVVFDGRQYKDLLHLPRILDALIAAADIPPVVVLFVDTPQRDVDLPCNPEFAAWVANELLPWAWAALPVSDRAADTIALGCSYGGLAAAYLALRYPERVGGVISQTGWFRWAPPEDPALEWLPRQYAAAPRLPVNFHLSAGVLETARMRDGGVTQRETNRRFHALLREKGYRVHYDEYHGGHDYSSLAEPLREALVLMAGRG